MSLESQPQKVTSPENQFGDLMFEEESKNFPGAKIVAFEKDGKIIRYALSRDEQGNLKGSKFDVQEYTIVSGMGDGFWKNSFVKTDAEGVLTVEGKEIPKFRIGPTYQMHTPELKEIEKALSERGINI